MIRCLNQLNVLKATRTELLVPLRPLASKSAPATSENMPDPSDKGAVTKEKIGNFSPFQGQATWSEFALARVDDLLNWARRVILLIS